MVLPKVVIVGAGVTGSVLASLVHDMGLSVRVVEKSRSAGGRMSTHRFRQGGRDTPVVARADLGAQYITTRSFKDHSVLSPLYKSLLDANVLKPFEGIVAGPNPYGGADESVKHFTSPTGMQAIPDFFLQRSNVAVDYGKAVENISLSPEGFLNIDGDGASEDNEPCIIVLTQPVRQILGESKFPLRGNFLEHSKLALAQLEKVEYSSRFALAFAFDSKLSSWPYEWAAHYYSDGDVRYIAHDSAKRNANDEPYLSVLVHSGVPLGIELSDEAEPFSRADSRIRADIKQKLPDIPWESAVDVKILKWKYSQVFKGLSGQRPSPAWVWDERSEDVKFPGVVELFRSPHALGLVAGDATAPAGNFEGCVYSAHRTAAAIQKFILQGSSEL